MTYLDVEPVSSALRRRRFHANKPVLPCRLLPLPHQITGFTLSFAKRIQMNMMYGPSPVIT